MIKHIVFGQVFADFNVTESIQGRLLGTPEEREAFFEREAKKLSPEVKEKVSAFLKATYGVSQVRFTYTRMAGCGMCPCSPGWSVSGKVDYNALNGGQFGGLMGHLEDLPVRERFAFYMEGNRISVRGNRKETHWKTRFHPNGRNRGSEKVTNFVQSEVATLV